MRLLTPTRRICTVIIAIFFIQACHPIRKTTSTPTRIIAFFTAKHDAAHISFVHEANAWFNGISQSNNLVYDTTSNWNNMNADFVSNYDLILFLDTRPEQTAHRLAFEQYMRRGGPWIGFHFAGFAMTPSAYPQDWDWYHQHFLGSGQYKSNTWRPTSATLLLEDTSHPTANSLPARFQSSPNEWYSWENDLGRNADIQILLSIDPSSFPLGTGPKQNEIWTSGYFPVAWTNKNYRMVYMNMGHNDMDYESGSNKQLSFHFVNEQQNRFLLNCIRWVTRK